MDMLQAPARLFCPSSCTAAPIPDARLPPPHRTCAPLRGHARRLRSVTFAMCPIFARAPPSANGCCIAYAPRCASAPRCLKHSAYYAARSPWAFRRCCTRTHIHGRLVRFGSLTTFYLHLLYLHNADNILFSCLTPARARHALHRRRDVSHGACLFAVQDTVARSTGHLLRISDASP